MANDLKFQEGQAPVDEHLRPIKVDDEMTAIETASHGNGARVNGDLQITGQVPKLSAGRVETNTIEGDSDMTISTPNGDITLVPATGQDVHIKSSAVTMTLNNGATGTTSIKQMSLVNTADYSILKTTTNGATTLETVDADASLAHLTIKADGDITLNPVGEDIEIQGNGTTYAKLSKTNSQLIFYENGGASTDDYLRIRCVANGETTITTVDAAGSDADLIMDVDGDITLDSQTGVFISKRAGVEFSPANSAYAGMILGYTRIQNDGTSIGEAHITMDGTLTVLQTASGTNVGVTFVAPPSGNVEITFSAVVYASSKTIEFALSDNTTHNEIAEAHTYDAGVVTSDETDRNKVNVDWAVTGLTAGTSYTYYISGAETVSGTSYIQHGRNRTTGSHYPPIIVKATALPATITTGE